MAVHPFLSCSMWEDNKQVVDELTSTALQYFDVKVEEEEKTASSCSSATNIVLYIPERNCSVARIISSPLMFCKALP